MKRPKKLSATFVKNVSHHGRYGDGRGGFGLSLLVKPMANGRVSKTWAQRLRINGRLTSVGLGRFPLVNLKEARQAAIENARAVTRGENPRANNSIPTFAEAAEKVLEIHRPTWKNPRTGKDWKTSLHLYAVKLHNKRVDTINTADVMTCLIPIWTDKPETARRLRRRLSAVFKWSVAQGFRGDDPAGDAISKALPRSNGRTRHMKALPYAEVSDALAKIRASGAHPGTKLCFELLVLTATRSGEARLATWDEIDFKKKIWIIPPERMKMAREHRIPLSKHAVKLLAKAQKLADGSGLVFPSITGKPLSDNTLSKLLRDLKVPAVPHGFRSSFRNYCAETGVVREVAEACLAHVVGGVEGAYFRSDLSQLRRKVMQDWAGYISKK